MINRHLCLAYIMILGWYLFVILSCTPIKYSDDINFIPSAMANSPEYLVKLNGTVCKDVDGIIGLCAKRVSADKDLKISVGEQDYAYTLNLDCSDNINFNTKINVPEKQKVDLIIPYANFSEERVFNCTLDVLPMDRPEPIASFAAFRVYVVKKGYTRLDDITRYNDKYLVLGKHAYKSKVIEGGNIKFLHEKTQFKTKSDVAIVESYNMRFSYRGI